MDIEKFTERSRGFIQAAQTAALGRGHQHFTPVHILASLLADTEGMASRLLAQAGGDVPRIQQAATRALDKMPTVDGSGAGQLYLTAEMAKLFETAKAASDKAGDEFITAEMLLLALVLVDGQAVAKMLADGVVTAQALNVAIYELRKGRSATSATAEGQYEALQKYTADLTTAARAGKLDPVIDRKSVV